MTTSAITNAYFGATANITFEKEYNGADLNEGAFHFTMEATDKDFKAREGAAIRYDEAFKDNGQAFKVPLSNGAFSGNKATTTRKYMRRSW